MSTDDRNQQKSIDSHNPIKKLELDEDFVSDLMPTETDSVQEEVKEVCPPLAIGEHGRDVSKGKKLVIDVPPETQIDSIRARTFEVDFEKPDDEISTASESSTDIKSEHAGSGDDPEPRKLESVQDKVCPPLVPPERNVDSITARAFEIDCKLSKKSCTSSMTNSILIINEKSDKEICEEDVRNKKKYISSTAVSQGIISDQEPKKPEPLQVLWKGNGTAQSLETFAELTNSSDTTVKPNDLLTDSKSDTKSTSNTKLCKEADHHEQQPLSRNPISEVDLSDDGSSMLKPKKLASDQEEKQQPTAARRIISRNPITGEGLGEDGFGVLRPKRPTRDREANPLTGEGYKSTRFW